MIRTTPTDWRVQIRDDDGYWRDHHAGSRASVAIEEYMALETAEKRLLRNGQALRMFGGDDGQPELFPA